MEQYGTEWNTFFAESPSGPPAAGKTKVRDLTLHLEGIRPNPTWPYPIAEVVESKVEGPFAASISSEKWPHEKTQSPIGRQDGHRPVGVRSRGIDRLQRTRHAGHDCDRCRCRSDYPGPSCRNHRLRPGSRLQPNDRANRESHYREESRIQLLSGSPPSNPSRPTAQGRRTTPYLRTASQSRSLPCWNPRCLMPSKPR